MWFCGYGWGSALEGPGSRAMELVGRLFRSRPWHLLVPDRQGGLLTAGGGDPDADDGAQAARAADGSFAMVFVPDRREVQVDLGQISGSSVRAWWFDIVTGRVVGAGDFPASGSRHITTPCATGRCSSSTMPRAGSAARPGRQLKRYFGRGGGASEARNSCRDRPRSRRTRDAPGGLIKPSSDYLSAWKLYSPRLPPRVPTTLLWSKVANERPIYKRCPATTCERFPLQCCFGTVDMPL